MSQHPAGVFTAGYPFQVGPPALPYYSALTSPERRICWLAKLAVDAVSTNRSIVKPLVAGVFHPLMRIETDVTTLTRSYRHYATQPFITTAEDDPVLTDIEARLSPVTLERRLETDGGRFAPIASSAIGQILLRNDDGALDDLDDDAAVIGRDVVISAAAMSGSSVVGVTVEDTLATESGDDLVTEDGDDLLVGSGSDGSSLAGFGEVYRGVVDAVGWNGSRAQLAVRDYRLRLQKPIQVDTYNGNGGVDGTPELAGRTKPLAFGRCLNVSPVLLDPARLIYQFHSREARAVDAVRDSGAELDLHRTVGSYDALLALTAPSSEESGDFPLGSYVACPAAGCFRLAGQPAGVVTADVRGDGGVDSLRQLFSDGRGFSDGTGFASSAQRSYARTAAQVLERLLIYYADFGPEDVNVSHLRQVALQRPYEVGMYLPSGATTSLQDVVALLVQSLGMVMIRGRDGRFQLRSLDPPLPWPVARIGTDMLDERQLQRVEVPYRQPWNAIEVAYGRNFTVQSDSDIVESVTHEERAVYMREHSVARAVDNELMTIYPDRAPLQVDTALTSAEDANAVAEQLLAFYARGRGMYAGSVRGVAFRLELLDSVRVTSPRFGLASGKDLIVVSIIEDGLSRSAKLELFG